jgi:hypothetical protein
MTKFLVAHAFELQPVRRAAALVRCVGFLGDHALVAALARRPVDGLTVLHPMRGIAQRILEVKSVAQQPFTPDERQLGDGMPVEVQQIEKVMDSVWH